MERMHCPHHIHLPLRFALSLFHICQKLCGLCTKLWQDWPVFDTKIWQSWHSTIHNTSPNLTGKFSRNNDPTVAHWGNTTNKLFLCLYYVVWNKVLNCLWTNLKTFSDSFLSTCGRDPKRMRQTELCVQLNCIKTTLGPHKMLSNISTFHYSQLLFAFNIKYSVDTKVLTVL